MSKVTIVHLGQPADAVLEVAASIPHKKGDVLCVRADIAGYEWRDKPGNGWMPFFQLHLVNDGVPPCAA